MNYVNKIAIDQVQKSEVLELGAIQSQRLIQGWHYYHELMHENGAKQVLWHSFGEKNRTILGQMMSGGPYLVFGQSCSSSPDC